MVWNVAGASELSPIWFGMFGCSQGYYETARQMRQAWAVNSVDEDGFKPLDWLVVHWSFGSARFIQPPISCLAYGCVWKQRSLITFPTNTHCHVLSYIRIYIYIGLYRVILGVHLTFSDAPILNMYQPTTLGLDLLGAAMPSNDLRCSAKLKTSSFYHFIVLSCALGMFQTMNGRPNSGINIG